MFDFNCGVDSVDESANSVIKKESVESILSLFSSGISFDIAKNHTGVCIWDGTRVELLGFDIDYSYDKDDYLAESKMRLWLKNKCYEIMKGKHFEVCQVEGVFGGENFDTSRKLIALNGVVAELILEEKVSVDYYYNLTQKEWAKDFRTIIKIGKGLNTKYETQEILKYLEFSYVLENESLSNKEKENIFYEDICDAVGMLCGLALRLKCKERNVKSSSVRLSNVKMYFIEEMSDVYGLGDKVVDSCEMVSSHFVSKDIQNEIVTCVSLNPNKVVSVCVNNSDLGTFGIRNGFEFFPQGYGYLIFYNKALRKGV